MSQLGVQLLFCTQIKVRKISDPDTNFEKKCVEVTISIPFMNPSEERTGYNKPGFVIDVIGAFSSYLIELLEARMTACYTKLTNHLDSVVFNNGYEIAWTRKDGSPDYFMIPSYNAMQEAVELLKKGRYQTFLSKTIYLDQTIKAIMNHPNLSHEDRNGFRFSQLVSILVEDFSASVWNQAVDR